MAEAKDVLDKYHNRKVRVAMRDEGTWPPERDPKDISRNSGKTRIWGPEHPAMPEANWAKHVKMHEERVGQIQSGDWWR